MSDEIRVIDLDRKWPLGVRVSEYKDIHRLDVRTYNPDGMQPTKKGISVSVDETLEVIAEMLDVYTEFTGQVYSLEISEDK